MSDDSDQEDWESEGEYDEDGGDGQYDDMDAITGDMTAGNKSVAQNPFAPAEMYLSDMIGSTSRLGDDENGDDLLIVNVSNSLVYSPPSADPLYAVDLQGCVIDLLLGLRSTDSKGAFRCISLAYALMIHYYIVYLP